MNQNGQRQTPETYTLPADLVSNIYQILSQTPAGGGVARVFVRLENEIGRQNQAWQARQAEQQKGTADDPLPAPPASEAQWMNVAKEEAAEEPEAA